LAWLLGLTCLTPLARAADPAPAPNYSGDLWTRSTLTGDWAGTRNQLADKGLTLDITYSQVYQGVVNGGLHDEWKYGGRGDLNFNLDTQKLGLWPGGFFNILAQGDYGESLGARQTGSFMPPNDLLLFPNPQPNQFSPSAVKFTQFVTPQLGFALGKIATLTEHDGDANAFAHGTGASGFLNTAFCFNPANAVAVPYSTLGAGLILLPTSDPNELLITLVVLDSEGEANRCGADTVFKGGTSYTAEGRYTTHFFNLTGHQLLGGAYSDRLFLDLDQPIRNIIIPALPVAQNSGSWVGFYNFDQYLWQPDPKVDQGIGIFGRFGITDGEANPIHMFASGGIGGKGMFPGRKNDRFGIGYYYIAASQGRLLEQLRVGDSQGAEAFYEFALTPWASLTADVQVIKSGLERVDCSTILGLRLTMKF
jgi:porin